MIAPDRRFGAQSMTGPLRDVLVKQPGAAFGAAFGDPTHGFLNAVDLEAAQREHAAFVETLAALGPRVHLLETEIDSPDLVYTFDPLLVTDSGAIALRRVPTPTGFSEIWRSKQLEYSALSRALS